MSNYNSLHDFLIKFIQRKEKFDQNLVKNKGKGKWDLIKATINDSKINFYDPGYEFLQIFLENFIDEKEKYTFNSKFECGFVLEDANIQKRVGVKTHRSFIVSFKLEDTNKDTPFIRGICNSKKMIDKKELLDFPKKYLSMFSTSFRKGIGGTVEIGIESPSMRLEIDIDDFTFDVIFFTAKIDEKVKNDF